MKLSDLVAPEPNLNCTLSAAEALLKQAQAAPSSKGQLCCLFVQAVGVDANKMIPLTGSQNNGLAVNTIEGVEKSFDLSQLSPPIDPGLDKLNFQLWRDVTVEMDTIAHNGNFYNVAQILKLMAGGSTFDGAVE